MASCVSTCDIFGSNRNPSFEDKKVAVVSENNNSNGLFSGREETITHISHGTFETSCSGGDPRLCGLFVADNQVGFIVVENGTLDVDLDGNGFAMVSGTKLNNKLSGYLAKLNAIENEIDHLDFQYISASLFTGDPDGILHREFQARCQELIKSRNELQTEFIINNFDNVLGKGFFIQLLNEKPTPEQKAQVEKILNKAPKSFKADEEIQQYLHRAGFKL